MLAVYRTESSDLNDLREDTNTDPEQFGGNCIVQEKIKENEKNSLKEELCVEDCDLESKRQMVDDMLAVYKTESADITDLLEDTNTDPEQFGGISSEEGEDKRRLTDYCKRRT